MLTLSEIIDKFAEQIDNDQFEEILKSRDLELVDKIEFVDFLYEELKSLGRSLYSYFPNLDREINAMSNQLQIAAACSDYNGERLWWLIEAEGNSDRAALYLHYYQNDDYYEVEKVNDERYAWYGSGDDWYICRADRWDINRFYRVMDACLAEE